MPKNPTPEEFDRLARKQARIKALTDGMKFLKALSEGTVKPGDPGVMASAKSAYDAITAQLSDDLTHIISLSADMEHVGVELRTANKLLQAHMAHRAD